LKQSTGAEVIAGGFDLLSSSSKIVHDELLRSWGNHVPWLKPLSPTVIPDGWVAGTGKTNRDSKVSFALTQQNRTCLMVATDVYRPAAADQPVTPGAVISASVLKWRCQIQAEIAPRWNRARAEGAGYRNY